MDFGVQVSNVFPIMWTMQRLFKTLMNFTFVKLDELMLLMVPTITCHAQSTSEQHIEILNLKFWF